MSMDPDSYTNSFGKRVRILFSPVRFSLFIAAVLFSIAANAVYIRNGGGPEWVGLASVIPLWSCVIWQGVTDARFRRQDREDARRLLN